MEHKRPGKGFLADQSTLIFAQPASQAHVFRSWHDRVIEWVIPTTLALRQHVVNVILGPLVTLCPQVSCCDAYAVKDVLAVWVGNEVVRGLFRGQAAIVPFGMHQHLWVLSQISVQFRQATTYEEKTQEHLQQGVSRYSGLTKAVAEAAAAEPAEMQCVLTWHCAKSQQTE